ncbi:MAG: YifB family Mg chelatase-like AAA ATPase [Lachnospiraceae bacterium]|nr:YifB family Mg chelatase-like AAA ATPase [Lachnospiraceae bacterium]
MYNILFSGGITSIEGNVISVETDVTSGLPYFSMVGLLSSEVKESGERVKSAIRNSGYYVSPGRITVSLTPGDIRKEGTGFDLAIALGILMSAKVLVLKDEDMQRLNKTLILGELGLDGSVKGINGVLPIILKAKLRGFTCCIIPKSNAGETHMIDGMKIYLVNNLKEAVDAINGNIMPYDNNIEYNKNDGYRFDISNVYGNDYAKRALLIAVCGMHNILFMGPPGAGKSMLAKCVPSIMPEPDMAERIDIASIYSICGLLKDDISFVKRPFRMPHHSITLKAFTGGGSYPKPGELTLAHRGVLFLDELPEFKSEVLESLREPLEDRYINIVRNKGTYKFPADFLLVAAMNNCKCGYYPDRNLCKCSEVEVSKYLNRVRGPLMDRIDMCINIPRVNINEIEAKRGNNSSELKNIVDKVMNIQQIRFKDLDIRYNSQMNNEQVKEYCTMTSEASNILKLAYDKMHMSVRIYYKIIKVARTIADIDNSDVINEKHIAEAIGYRNMI